MENGVFLFFNVQTSKLKHDPLPQVVPVAPGELVDAIQMVT